MPTLLRAGLILFLVAATVTVATAESTTSGIAGVMVGDRGGAFATWEVDLPTSSDVTLTLAHWPCNAGRAIGLLVYDSSGILASGSTTGPCTIGARLHSGEGGPAVIRMHNYLHGVGTWYPLSAEGLQLPDDTPTGPVDEPADGDGGDVETPLAGEVSPPAPDRDAPRAVVAGAGVTVARSMGGDETVAPSRGGGTMLAEDATLVGDVGGAFHQYDLIVEAGQEITLRMDYTMADGGGTAPGVGFKVWGPNDTLLIESIRTDPYVEEATFTAPGNLTLLIQVMNYHHGQAMNYTLGLPGGSEA